MLPSGSGHGKQLEPGTRARGRRGDRQFQSARPAHDIGPCRAVIEEHIPGAHFLYQQDLSALEQISKYSAFPFFYSNLTRSLRMTDEWFMTHTRTAVSIADPANRINFYATFLCDNRRLALLIQQYLAQHWPREQ